MTKEEFEKMPRGKEITAKEDYICTNINPEEMVYAIRIKPNAPTVYTMAQYVKLVKTLSKLEGEAKGKAKTHYELARQTGLIYFVGGLEGPTLKTWKMRE